MFKQAREYLSNGEFDKARPLLEELDKENHGLAQCDLGKMYWCGQGVEENLDKALEYFLKSAKNKYEPAAKCASKILRHQWSVLMKERYADNPELLKLIGEPLIAPIMEDDSLVVMFLTYSEEEHKAYTQELLDELKDVFEKYYCGRFKVITGIATLTTKKA